MEKSADHDGGFGFLEFRGGPNEIRFRKRKEIRRATMEDFYKNRVDFFQGVIWKKNPRAFCSNHGAAAPRPRIGEVSTPGDLFVCGAGCPHGSGVLWLLSHAGQASRLSACCFQIPAQADWERLRSQAGGIFRWQAGPME
jgi:hypothetical protein